MLLSGWSPYCRDSFSQWADDSQELVPLSRSEHFIYYNEIEAYLLEHAVNFRMLSLLKESFEFQNNYLINMSILAYTFVAEMLFYGANVILKKEQINKIYIRTRIGKFNFIRSCFDPF